MYFDIDISSFDGRIEKIGDARMKETARFSVRGCNPLYRPRMN